jgi:hypothetical protein
VSFYEIEELSAVSIVDGAIWLALHTSLDRRVKED